MVLFYADMAINIDHMIDISPVDAKILLALQREGNLSQRALAEKVGLSQNACWRRLKRLHDEGLIEGYHARVNSKLVGLDLTVFMMIRTRNHSADWADKLRRHVSSIPDVIEMHRIGGDWDYLLKVVTRSMEGYDRVYQRLTSGLEIETVTGLFAMETIFENRPLRCGPA